MKNIDSQSSTITTSRKFSFLTTEEVRERRSTTKKIRNILALGIFTLVNSIVISFIIAHFNLSYLQGPIGIGLNLSQEIADIIFSYSVAAGSFGFLGTVIIGGAFSDDYRSNYGARAPYILGGCLIAGLTLIITPIFARVAEREFMTFLFPVCFFLIYVGLGLASSPSGALMSELFSKEQRNWVGLILAGFAIIGSSIGLILFPIFSSVLNDVLIRLNLNLLISGVSYFLFPALTLILAGIAIFFLVEKANPPFPPIDSPITDILKTPKYLFLGGSDFGKMFFVQSFWGFAGETVSIYLLIHLTTENGIPKSDAPMALLLVGIVSAIMVIPAGLFIRKFGKVKTAILGSFFYSIFCFLLAGMEIGNYYSLLIIVVAIGGFGAVFIEAVRVSLPADLVPEGKEAQFMGINKFGSTWTQPIVAIVGGFILSSISLDMFFPSLRGMSSTAIIFSLAGIATLLATVLLFLISYEKMVRTEYQKFYKRYLAARGFIEDKMDTFVDTVI